jgi:hypothetical protein
MSSMWRSLLFAASVPVAVLTAGCLHSGDYAGVERLEARQRADEEVVRRYQIVPGLSDRVDAIETREGSTPNGQEAWVFAYDVRALGDRRASAPSLVCAYVWDGGVELVEPSGPWTEGTCAEGRAR